jgi:hypothetical protein
MTKGFWVVAKAAFAIFAVGVAGVIILQVAGNMNACGLFNAMISNINSAVGNIINMECPF